MLIKSLLWKKKNSALLNDESSSIPAPIVTLVNKQGSKPKNKHNTKRTQVEEDTDNSIRGDCVSTCRHAEESTCTKIKSLQVN
jgi:hypothetical protein